MNVRQRKRVLFAAAGALALGAAGVVVAGLALPVRVEAPEVAGRKFHESAKREMSQPSAEERAEASRRRLVRLEQLCRTELRRPLFDPPSKPPAANPTPSAPPLTLRLVGTVNERGHSMAVFQKPDGSQLICARGETVDDSGGLVTVTRVGPETVTVRYGNQFHELAREPDSPAGRRP